MTRPVTCPDCGDLHPYPCPPAAGCVCCAAIDKATAAAMIADAGIPESPKESPLDVAIRRLRAAQDDVTEAAIAEFRDQVRAEWPTAAAVRLFGDRDDDGYPTFLIDQVLDAAGEVLVDADVPTEADPHNDRLTELESDPLGWVAAHSQAWEPGPFQLSLDDLVLSSVDFLARNP